MAANYAAFKMTDNDYVELVKLFKVTVDGTGHVVDSNKLNQLAMMRGYIVEPNACTSIVNDFIKSLECNINSTFYKTFEDVTSKTRFELFIDQVFHYMTTYGTDFSLGNGYVPNENPENVEYISLLRDYTVIKSVTDAVMFEKCINMLKSGIAMKQTTLYPICKFVCNYYVNHTEEFKGGFCIDLVMNKEAVTMICDWLNIAPNRKFDLFRYIIYKTTGSTMIIKNRDLINRIKSSSNQFDFAILTDEQINSLASIFYRFKPLFLAFKKQQIGWRNATASANAPIINKIRRRAVKYHTPFDAPIESTILSKVYDRDKLMLIAAGMNIYQVVRLCNACAERITRLGEASMYVIRSGRMFIKDPANDYTGMKRYYMTVYDVLYDELRCRLMENACYVKYNKGINIAVPTSEKNFVGDIPFGSYINIADHAMIGIYWRNAWGTRDFDLSMTDIKGNKIGWNSAYYSDKQDVIYSGDMTCADPEATEILYYKNNAPQGFININRYSGNDGSKYKLFVANEEVQTLRKNYIVDPTRITFEAMCVSDTPQQVIGLVNGNSFTIMNVGNGYGQVSRRNGNEQKSFDALSHKACSYLELKQLLHDAGYIDIDTVEETDDWKIPADAKIIDLTTLSRDTLINIMEGNA